MFPNMSASSSSSSDDVHPDLRNFSNSSLPSLDPECFRSSVGIALFSAFSITYILLLLPVFFLVFYLGYRHWRTRRSMPTAAAAFNPDLFTYHCIAMQLTEFLAIMLHFCGGYNAVSEMMEVGLCLWIFTTIGQTLFHLLSCLELYLAVVHPITYLGLGKPRGVRFRNIITGCVWLISFGWLSVLYLVHSRIPFCFYVSVIVVFIVVISFCSVFILCTLKRPGPGDGLGGRQQAGQSKQRAFHTIMAIMGVLLLRFSGSLVSNVMHMTDMQGPRQVCVAFLSAFWLDLPSNLVLPLRFLRRAGKLHC